MTSRLEGLMSAVAAEMRASLQKTHAALTHGLSIGEANETIVREFFRERLPSSLAVAHGQIMDSQGQVSRQLDVVIYDAACTPVLFADAEAGIRLFPAEGVVAVVEVKTSLSASDAAGVVANMRSVKSLDRSAYYSGLDGVVHLKNVFGGSYELQPILYYVFAFESSALDGICAKLAKEMSPAPLAERVDCLVVLERGVLLWRDPATEMVDAAPSDLSQSFASYETENALLLFYTMICRHLLQLRGGVVDLHKYLPSGSI